MKTRTSFPIGFCCAVLLLASFNGGCDAPDGGEDTAPARVAIVVDQSRSFVGQLPTVAKIVSRFIRENALSGESEIYLISMDRAPDSQNFYKAGELLDATDNEVLKKLTLTHALDGTDVVGALDVARRKLRERTDVKPGKLFLLAFSDMQVDPAKTPPAKTFRPLEAFRWADLKGVKCRFYFVAQNQQDRLSTLLEKNGLDGLAFDPQRSRREAIPGGSDDEGE
jgi:hypothetical protein